MAYNNAESALHSEFSTMDREHYFQFAIGWVHRYETKGYGGSPIYLLINISI